MLESIYVSILGLVFDEHGLEGTKSYRDVVSAIEWVCLQQCLLENFRILFIHDRYFLVEFTATTILLLLHSDSLLLVGGVRCSKGSFGC